MLCGISTQLKQHIANFDEIITPSDADFELSGLKSASVIRLGFLTVIPNRMVIGAIAQISSQRHYQLLDNLSQYLIENPN